MRGAKLGYCLHGTTAAHHSTVQKGRPWVLGYQDAPVAALCLLPDLLPLTVVYQACSWPCMGTDNLGHSGETGQLKTSNGQIEGCSAAQWLNTLSSGFPRLSCLCPELGRADSQRMLIFSELSCSWSSWQRWHQSPSETPLGTPSCISQQR